MNGNYNLDPNRNKTKKWTARHFGSFMQTGMGKDSTTNALNELCTQFEDGRFRELQCTIEIDRDRKVLTVKRWLDQVILEEFNLLSITNVLSHQSVPRNAFLTNVLTFNTQTKTSKNVLTETHIFQLEDPNFHMVNYLASDIRSAIEAASNMKNTPVKVLPQTRKSSLSSEKVYHFESVPKSNDIASKTERNLLLLNYCFDDIELFLQHLKDQEEAQAILKSSKGKVLSDRLLEGRAKPSTQNAYVTCIEKIKFSLNLLSKLDGKIKNPDSQQLVLLLIENLIKIGHAFSIYHNGKLSKIKEPLLTDETIKLLQRSLSKNFLKQFISWGEFWNKPREKWSGYKEKYYPNFFNGYQIDLEELVKDDIISSEIDTPVRSMNNEQINEVIMSNIPTAPPPPSAPPSLNKFENPTLSPRQEDFCRSVTLRKGRLFRAINTFTASKDEELSIIEGEIIEVIESKPDKNWWLCGNMQGQKGYSPCTVLQMYTYIDKTINSKFGRYTPEPKSAEYATPSPLSPSALSGKRVSMIPETSQADKEREAQLINEELQKRISNISNFGPRNARASFARPGQVATKKEDQLSINQDSTCEDVQKFLRLKKFSESDIQKLNIFNGLSLFILTRDEMNRIVGVDVAARLDSVIKVQKSLSGYGTMSRRELAEILSKRKEQVEFSEQF